MLDNNQLTLIVALQNSLVCPQKLPERRCYEQQQG